MTVNPPEPCLELVFELCVDVLEGWHVGRGEQERLWFTPIVGGTVRGPRLNGVVLSGGGDWSVRRGDTTELNARYLLRADDGAVIDIHNRGYYRASPGVEARIEAGEAVPETEYYFRTAPVFQTDARAHRWLAENQFIGLARDEAGQIRIRCFLVV